MGGVLVTHGRTGQACGVHLPERDLSDREKAILDLERSWWTLDANKDDLITERFSCTPEEYAAELEDLADRPEALAYDPLVVRRIIRMRDRRRRTRRQGAERTEPAPGTDTTDLRGART